MASISMGVPLSGSPGRHKYDQLMAYLDQARRRWSTRFNPNFIVDTAGGVIMKDHNRRSAEPLNEKALRKPEDPVLASEFSRQPWCRRWMAHRVGTKFMLCRGLEFDLNQLDVRFFPRAGIVSNFPGGHRPRGPRRQAGRAAWSKCGPRGDPDHRGSTLHRRPARMPLSPT